MPLVLALLGALIGVLICRLFVRSWLAYPAAAIIGAVSAFMGIVTRDAFDATLLSSNTLLDTLFAAVLMAAVVSLIANIVTSIISPRKDKQR